MASITRTTYPLDDGLTELVITNHDEGKRYVVTLDKKGEPISGTYRSEKV